MRGENVVPPSTTGSTGLTTTFTSLVPFELQARKNVKFVGHNIGWF
jgi:hypothetical protein